MGTKKIINRIDMLAGVTLHLYFFAVKSPLISKERSMFNSAGKFDDIRRVITVMASKGIVMPPDSSSGAAKLLKSTIFTHEPEPHENSSLLTDQFSTALRNCSFILPELCTWTSMPCSLLYLKTPLLSAGT